MSDSYIGFGYQPRCPNCGSATVVEHVSEDGTKHLLCASCGEHHERDASGRLVLEEDSP